MSAHMTPRASPGWGMYFLLALGALGVIYLIGGHQVFSLPVSPVAPSAAPIPSPRRSARQFPARILIASMLPFTRWSQLNHLKGLKDIDVVPNGAFWASVPGLFKDGIGVIMRKLTCGGGDGYAPVSDREEPDEEKGRAQVSGIEGDTASMAISIVEAGGRETKSKKHKSKKEKGEKKKRRDSSPGALLPLTHLVCLVCTTCRLSPYLSMGSRALITRTSKQASRD